MSSVRKSILVVSGNDLPVIANDVATLERLGDVEFLRYRGHRDLPRLVVSAARADLLVCWFALGYATTAALTRRILSKPTIVITAGWDVVAVPEVGHGALLSPGRKWKTTLALRAATLVLAVSNENRGATSRIVNRDVRTLYNGVDTVYFGYSEGPRKPRVISSAGVDSKARYLVKGVDVLFELAGRMPEVPFVLVGRNSADWHEKLCGAAPSNVRVTGHLPRQELRSLYQSSAAYVQLSRYESFGVAMAEAMACGCTPIVSNRGALPEVVGDTGTVVPFGDLGAAERAVRQALLISRSSPECRRRVEDMFSLERRATDLIDWVERTCQW